ncbi:polyphosphate kinase 2, PA0141 family [Devosia enhydra]|uniref:ADP/GDP-polyphosphate phosphotransferase n=1 Tax=Devosia enhydra TaxID=665118 RepID=A0A1K2I1P9_9HYPH|nr:polyphosphate kinase 2 [Devosia enhydra]SFZ86310.1 polyphosphate kinase 2, PA0141 family [Devosia enhydra]
MSDLDFDLDAPELPRSIKKGAITSGGYPYAAGMEKEEYEAALYQLHLQLALLQKHEIATGQRTVIVFEGRDAAGKGGAIATYVEHLNPRLTYHVALPKPSDRERTQWYFQRYVDWLPAAGETALFDRSWYNRAGVEPVMGFCTPEETEKFLAEAPRFEQMLVNDGIKLFKFWLAIGREMQMKRFHDRRHDPLKHWKLSPVDLEALARYDAYSAARTRMIETTHTRHAPWTVIRANDKRRARLNLIRTVLLGLDYEGKDLAAIGAVDPLIALPGPAFLDQTDGC